VDRSQKPLTLLHRQTERRLTEEPFIFTPNHYYRNREITQPTTADKSPLIQTNPRDALPHTKLDIHCEKLATHVPLRNFLSPEFGTTFQDEVPLFLEIPELPSNKARSVKSFS